MASMDDVHSSASSTSSDPLDLQGEEGYEDVESDQEPIEVVGLFDEQKYPDAKSMLQECKEKYSFDFIDTQKRLELDFYGLIKLVNYIRSEVKAGNRSPDFTSKEKFSNDKYLQPVLEDDALLFSLDDLLEPEPNLKPSETVESMSKEELVGRVTELEDALRRVTRDYAAYKEVAERTLDERWNTNEPVNMQKEVSSAATEVDKGYFSSYSFTEIHESMIKDSVRTNAYRDFIMKHSDLFQGKTVLDIGCGSGILSLFCAQAGAAKVIAVDNSNIIDIARLNVHANGCDSKITCVRGKIEEVTLPVKEVDIIVSEWMGYGLLFEGMFDSVLWARDRYLKPGGLMVPSHCSLHIGLLKKDRDLEEKQKFWADVYGFNMLSMVANDTYYKENARIEYPNQDDVARPYFDFLQLNAHTVSVADLSFKKNFVIPIEEDLESLAGWLVWFDILFLPDPTMVLSKSIQETATSGDFVAFTTGPYGPETHWKCALMATEQLPQVSLKKGSKIIGHVQYEKAATSVRGLVITIDWEGDDSRVRGKNKWMLS